MKKIKNLLLFLCLSLITFTSSHSQNIEFKNTTDSPLFNFLDTSFNINNQSIKVFIGPEVKKSRNTIFFNKPFLITNSTLNQFRIKGVFLQNLILKNCKLNCPIQIDSTAFDTLFIEKSSLTTQIKFKNIQVQNFSFTENTYPSEILFLDCTFKNFSFKKSILNTRVKFIGCSFENLDFSSCEFNQTLDLTGTSLANINFDSCTFNKNLFLSSLTLTPNSRFSFLNTTLPDTLDFSYNFNIDQKVDFTKVNYNKNLDRKCRIILTKTDLSNLEFNYQFFKLSFPDNLRDDDKETIYEGLLQNFKSKSFQESYRLLDIEYQRFKTKNGTLGFLWWIPEYWNNYGYNRDYIFRWTFGFLVVFTFINFCSYNRLLKIYKIQSLPTYQRKFNFSRIWYAFVLTSIIFFSFSLKFDKINFKSKGGTIYLILIYTIGLICLAYMANFILQK